MIGFAPRRLHFGDWLLEFPLTEIIKDQDKSIRTAKRLNVAREVLAKASAELFGTPLAGQGTEPMVSKQLYEASMRLRETGNFATGDRKMDDPENWLRDRLRLRRRVTYDRRIDF
jgi:hypothetical protein